MVKTKIRLIIFFAAKDVEALYSQQKQDQELTVAQIMNSLPNSDLFLGAPKSLQMVIAAMKLKDTYSLEGKL